MEPVKSFLMSKTLIGIAVMLASYFFGTDVATALGYSIEQAQEVVTAGITTGAVLAAIGRILVRHALVLFPPKKPVNEKPNE